MYALIVTIFGIETEPAAIEEEPVIEDLPAKKKDAGGKSPKKHISVDGEDLKSLFEETRGRPKKDYRPHPKFRV